MHAAALLTRRRLRGCLVPWLRTCQLGRLGSFATRIRADVKMSDALDAWHAGLAPRGTQALLSLAPNPNPKPNPKPIPNPHPQP